MITIERTQSWELPAVFLLYCTAFPRNERKPFSRIRSTVREGRGDLWTIRTDGRFAGFAATINSPELVLLDYFAVRKRLRGQGTGGAALKRLLECYRDRGFLVEIESTLEKCANLPQRLRRKRFYTNCGLLPLDLEADLFGVRMELLGLNCRLDFEQYRAFYREHYSPWAAERIRPVKEEP